MKALLKACLTTAMVGLMGSAFAQASPVGLWKTIDDDTNQEKSFVRIVEVSGTLSGKIEKILDATKQDSTCEKCTDSRKNQKVLGMTIIEKIERYANDADFALVLYTPCDHGRGAQDTKVPPRNRARQNVIFEHGYLMAKLGRENVCALVKGDIETPNDISGVVYVAFDAHGAWKVEVAKELKACGYELRSLV